MLPAMTVCSSLSKLASAPESRANGGRIMVRCRSNIILGLTILSLLVLTGCGGGNSGGVGGGLVTETSISGQVSVPTVNANGLLTSISYSNDPAVLEKFAKSGTCTVNGLPVPFTLSPVNRYFQIDHLAIAEKYDVRLTCGGLTLRLLAPHTSTSIQKDLGLDSTAEALLLERYGVSADQMKTLRVKDDIRGQLANKILSLLQGTTQTSVSVASGMATELETIVGQYSLADATFNTTPPIVGVWKGTDCIFYALNGVGERLWKITADIELTVAEGTAGMAGMIGKLQIKVKNKERQPVDTSSSYTPEDETRTLEGTFVGGVLTLDRIGAAGPRNGQTVETWELKVSAALLEGSIRNRDTSEFTGFDSDGKAIKLVRQ